MIITNSRYALVGYFITSYPTRAHGIIYCYLSAKFYAFISYLKKISARSKHHIFSLIIYLKMSRQTGIYNLCNASTSESTQQFVIVKNKLTSVFKASVLFLTVNFIIMITLSKYGSLQIHSLLPCGPTATLTML